MNPWHDVNIGVNAPMVVNGIIEIQKSSRAKYELDKETGMLKLDRVLYSAMYYPANYGFIPQTYCDDKDPLDILILSQLQIEPMCIVSAKVIGVMRMLDGDEMDDKIIAVAEHEDYKKLENKRVIVEDFQRKDVAMEIVAKAVEDYKEKFDLSKSPLQLSK
jgi:inorganic pyrophosphatase